MSTADGIFADGSFAEGVNNDNEINDILNDDDIVTAINETPGQKQHIEPEAVEMYERENQEQGRLYSVDKVEEDNKSKLVTILLAVLIIYSVIVSTVALIIALNNNASTSTMPSCDCTLNSLAAKTNANIFCTVIDICLDIKANHSIPSISPSVSPSISPSISPTILPSISPSIMPIRSPSTSKPTYMEPTELPTLEPTIEPTLQPSHSPTYFDGYFVGDFKFSLKSSHHGFWRLCDGERYRIDGQYSLLFQEIGFKFGSYNETISNITYQYFKIPNISDSVVGIAGNNHIIGQQIGDEGVVLTNNNIPAHTHKAISWAQTSDGTSNYEDRSICQTGNGFSYNLNHCPLANGWATGYQYQYGSIPISVMQPTTFISNLFIYTGVSL